MGMEIFQKGWDILSSISLVRGIGITVATLAGVFSIYFWRYLKGQLKLGKNLKRKIYFLTTSNVISLQAEKDNIKEIGLFNIENETKDISDGLKELQPLDKRAVYIVGYDENYGNKKYKDLINRVENNGIPIIIFSGREKITPKDWEVFRSYIYCDIANTTNRLAILLLNMLNIVPVKKK